MSTIDQCLCQQTRLCCRVIIWTMECLPLVVVVVGVEVAVAKTFKTNQQTSSRRQALPAKPTWMCCSRHGCAIFFVPQGGVCIHHCKLIGGIGHFCCEETIVGLTAATSFEHVYLFSCLDSKWVFSLLFTPVSLLLIFIPCRSI